MWKNAFVPVSLGSPVTVHSSTVELGLGKKHHVVKNGWQWAERAVCFHSLLQHKRTALISQWRARNSPAWEDKGHIQGNKETDWSSAYLVPFLLLSLPSYLGLTCLCLASGTWQMVFRILLQDVVFCTFEVSSVFGAGREKWRRYFLFWVLDEWTQRMFDRYRDEASRLRILMA